jgi:hypothetical protein
MMRPSDNSGRGAASDWFQRLRRRLACPDLDGRQFARANEGVDLPGRNVQHFRRVGESQESTESIRSRKIVHSSIMKPRLIDRRACG